MSQYTIEEPQLGHTSPDQYSTIIPYDYGTDFQYTSSSLTSEEVGRQTQLSVFHTTSEVTDDFEILCITILSNESLANRVPDEAWW